MKNEMENIGLEFLTNEGGEAEGLSDAGIETFRENPFAAVARETGQNSRDARADTDRPVLLKFDMITIPAAEFPSVEEYREAAQLCLTKSEDNEREKETGFFRNAVSVLNADEIRILRIADYNTKGVRGPCEEGRPFHTLAKTDGMSVKEDISSGGSFGIGKNATFALSDLQTVFISTRYLDADETEHNLCMGKTQFISHTDADGIERRRKGYWGITDGYMPLDKLDEMPDWLRRDEQGTSIFSIGLRDTRTDWRYEITAELLINFFAAIERQEMEFEIDEASILINRNTIQSLFADESVNKAVDQLNVRYSFDAARTLHQCLTGNQTSSEILTVPDLGNVRMSILLRDGIGYTIGIIRNGMYITDNLAYFNEPFKRFPLHRDFAVIIEPEGSTESEWFKRLENPRHDALSADRITDPQLREKGQKAFETLAKEIRTRIRAAAKSEPEDSIDLDELNEFFATDGSKTEDPEGTETDPRAKKPTVIKPSKPKKPQPEPEQFGAPDDPPGPGPGPGPAPPGPGPVPPGPGPNPRPRARKNPVELIAERALIPDTSRLSLRRLLFTSPVTGDLLIVAKASGLNSEEDLPIAKTTVGSIEEGALAISCKEGDRTTVDVEFDVEYAGPIEMYAHEINENGGAA
ncbi:MAG: hypothetical protein ACTS1Z_15035 [Parasphingopyxis sp.]|uniref:hypothetical protein n=1 Tax=Parasphingopyxis sp. TaxID=1920299 RepID=UPI003FA191BE